ncbi:MAG TPA: trypsin-like peptidase domain-containing protein [Gemmatimonadales bacterium]|nr:trypsin-like peptidase domain-containing protein [Gemmatimonadales bacterium]
MSVRSQNWLKFGGLVALAFALGLLFAGLLDLPTRSSAQELSQASAGSITPVAPPSIPEAKPLADLSNAFAAVAQAVVPSVVYVRSQHTEMVRGPQVPREFRRFFNMPSDSGPRLEQGTGSGFIVSADGYILTNNHVVAGADKVTVRLHDEREFVAKVVGTDPNTDVAVLKIDAQDLKPIALGNSDNERVGEWVLAIGNPLGNQLTFTVTSGIISAKGRSLQGLKTSNLSISDFIQTDAAINPGNSGGPLVNVQGEAIGINSAIASETGFYSGYGFAIPINLVKQVMDQLIETGTVHRAAIGVTIQDASRLDAQYVGLDQIRGVTIQSITDPDSPAGKAGLRAGDVILSVDGRPMYRTGQLQQEIGFRKPGDEVKIEVARKGGVRKVVTVKLQALNEALAGSAQDSTGDDSADSGETQPAGTTQSLLGARVQTVTSAMADQLGLPANVRGVLITDITPGGPAWEAQLIEPDQGQAVADIITAVEDKPVRSEAELSAALKSAGPGKIVTLHLYRTRVGDFIERVQLAEK